MLVVLSEVSVVPSSKTILKLLSLVLCTWSCLCNSSLIILLQDTGVGGISEYEVTVWIYSYFANANRELGGCAR